MFNTRVHPEEIAEKFIAMNCAEESDRNDLEEALYQLHAICENEYNHDFYRVLYKALEELAGTKFEISATYYEAGYKGETRRQRFTGESIEEAYNKYIAAGDVHDLAKYTPRTITSVDSYTTI